MVCLEYNLQEGRGEEVGDEEGSECYVTSQASWRNRGPEKEEKRTRVGPLVPTSSLWSLGLRPLPSH
jgi:hypothetical protein